MAVSHCLLLSSLKQSRFSLITASLRYYYQGWKEMFCIIKDMTVIISLKSYRQKKKKKWSETQKGQQCDRGAAASSSCLQADAGRTCLLPKARAGSHYCSIDLQVHIRPRLLGPRQRRKDPWDVQRRWKWKAPVNDRGQDMRPWRPRVDLLELYWS